MAMIDCPECGKQISDKAPACNNCGVPIAQQQTPVTSPVQQIQQQPIQQPIQQPYQQPLQNVQQASFPPGGLTCRKCGSTNVNVQMVQTGASTSTKGKGCLFTLARWTMIVCTCGLWLLVGKKKAKSTTTYSNQKLAVCSSCGNSWPV